MEKYKTVTILAANLEPGNVMLGHAGGTSMVDNVERSSARPGLLLVETEHGALYLDPEAAVSVIVG